MKEKLIDFWKKNKLIIIIVILALIIKIVTLIKLGYSYNINSDDTAYINSGIIFSKTGQITLRGALSAQQMPGIAVLVGIFAFIFGSGKTFLIVLKLFYIFLSLASLVGVYKIIQLYCKKWIAVLPIVLLLNIDFAWMDNLILTETPFIFCLVFLIYFSLKMAKSKNWKDFIKFLIFYLIGIMFRPTIGIYPAVLLIYLLLSKYTFKLLVKQYCIIIASVLIVLVPWTIRNYNLFHDFVPLTYGEGNPLLLGTYQGIGYPKDEELDYIKNVDSKFTEEQLYHLNNYTPGDRWYGYYALKHDEVMAKYRMKIWWNTNKGSMIKSYLIYKPQIIICNAFYWKELFGISKDSIIFTRKIDLILTCIAMLIIILRKKNIKELLLLFLIYVSQVLIYSYTFAFDRYGQPILFIRYIIIAIGIEQLYLFLKETKNRKEIKND